MPSINIKQLLEAGVHFGHQTKRWNPKMKEYIFGERNGIYIIDLQKTLKFFRTALELVVQLATQGKIILFVGTKRQAQEAIAEEAKRCGMYFVNQRWLGGLLTNFSTIQKSIQRLKELEGMKEGGQYNLLSKKEVGRLERERKKLEKNLSGIKEMKRLPDAIFIIDSMKENIAIREAKKLDILVIGVVDTNCDPELIDYVIPGNDDALKSVKLITSAIADAIIEGKNISQAIQAEEQAAREKAELERRSVASSSPADSGAIEGGGAPGTETTESHGLIVERPTVFRKDAKPTPGSPTTQQTDKTRREPRRRFEKSSPSSASGSEKKKMPARKPAEGEKHETPTPPPAEAPGEPAIQTGGIEPPAPPPSQSAQQPVAQEGNEETIKVESGAQVEPQPAEENS